MFNTVCRTAVAAAALAASPAYSAVVISLDGLTFQDGAAISGSVTLDDARSTIDAFSVSVGAGRLFLFGVPIAGLGVPVDAFVYDSNSATASLNLDSISLTANDPAFGTPFTRSFGFSFDGNDAVTSGLENIFIFGRSIGAAVPEPASWALMALGFGVAGAALRRRRRHAVA